MESPAWQTGPPPPPRQHPTSGVLALIMGILGLTALPLIGAVLALVFGYQSRGEVARNPAVYSDDLGKVGRILGWIGLALGIVGLALFLLLAFALVASDMWSAPF